MAGFPCITPKNLSAFAGKPAEQHAGNIREDLRELRLVIEQAADRIIVDCRGMKVEGCRYNIVEEMFSVLTGPVDHERAARALADLLESQGRKLAP